MSVATSLCAIVGGLRYTAAGNYKSCPADVPLIDTGVIVNGCRGTAGAAGYRGDVVRVDGDRPDPERRVREGVPRAGLLEVHAVVIVGQPVDAGRRCAAAAALEAVAGPAAPVGHVVSVVFGFGRRYCSDDKQRSKRRHECTRSHGVFVRCCFRGYSFRPPP